MIRPTWHKQHDCLGRLTTGALYDILTDALENQKISNVTIWLYRDGIVGACNDIHETPPMIVGTGMRGYYSEALSLIVPE